MTSRTLLPGTTGHALETVTALTLAGLATLPLPPARAAAAEVQVASPAPRRAARIWLVDNRHPAAADTNAGTAEAPLRSIAAAARQAGPGDEVRVAPGVYRELVAPEQGGTPEAPIRYLATQPGATIVKGSEVWSGDWQRLPGSGGAWHSPIRPAFCQGARNPFLRRLSVAPRQDQRPARPLADSAAAGPWPLTLAQVFVAGTPYRQLERLELVHRCPGTWIASADGQSLVVHFLPGQEPAAAPLVEVSVRDRIFAPRQRGLGYLEIRGFVFEHCANPAPFPQGGAVSTRSGHHWRIVDNTIRYAQTAGLDCGSEGWEGVDPKGNYDAGYHLIARNQISDNGLVGIAGWKHRDTIVRENLIERNNGIDLASARVEWEEWGGLKFHHCDGARIEANLVRDNEGHGIWLDNRWPDVRVTRNLVLNNRMAGIFLELGEGPVLIDNNIVAHTRSRGTYYEGTGIYAHDAAGITVAHNLVLANAGCGVTMRTTTDRKYDGRLVQSSHERILNNLILENGGAAVNLPFPNPRAEDNRSDGNVLFGTREFWQGLDQWPGLMAVNRFKNEAGNEQIVAALAAALRQAAVPETDWPNLKTWPRNPVLSLRLWQLFTGQDRASRESAGALACHLRPRQELLELVAGDDLWRTPCQPVPGVDKDYSGQPLPAANPLPGPFQALPRGATTLVLWPPAAPTP